jgi:branched-chain amino acid aminotransferase|tara:strand:- start:1374 stop:1640 length:267 start_codon:yes stop_codon:yes gene_type:complete
MQQALSAGATWMNGTIITISEASFPVTDWGLTHSDITYDVAPVRDGAFFRLNDYIDRSCAINLGITYDEMILLLSRNRLNSHIMSSAI